MVAHKQTYGKQEKKGKDGIKLQHQNAGQKITGLIQRHKKQKQTVSALTCGTGAIHEESHQKQAEDVRDFCDQNKSLGLPHNGDIEKFAKEADPVIQIVKQRRIGDAVAVIKSHPGII